MDSLDSTPARRRTFLLMLAGGLGGVLTAAAAWPLARFLAPAGGGGSDQVLVPRGAVKAGEAHFFSYRGKPVVALQPKPGEYLALSAVCTHLGCVVQWEAAKEEFLCPCHGGRFAVNGTVLSGPPPQPLASLPVMIDGDQLKIG